MENCKLVIVVSQSCEPCKEFENKYYKSIENKIGKKNIALCIITSGEVFSTGQKRLNYRNAVINGSIPRNVHHPQLSGIKWTPSILLVTKESWENKEGFLEGEIFGGYISIGINRSMNGQHVNDFTRMKTPMKGSLTKDELTKYKKESSFETKKVIDWIKDNLENNEIFSHDKHEFYKNENEDEQIQNYLGSMSSLKYSHRPVAKYR